MATMGNQKENNQSTKKEKISTPIVDGAVVDEDEIIKEFVTSIPDDIWMELALTQRRELYKICAALSLDLHFIKHESTSNR